VAELEAIFYGDNHFGGLGSLFPNYSFDPDDMAYKSLAYALDYAKENGIKDVFLLGDVFHTPHPTQSQQRRLLRFFLKYPRLRIHAIAGNHDFSTEDELSLEMVDFTAEISSNLEHVKFYTKPTLLEIKGVPVSLLPWPHASTLEKSSLNVAHIEVSNSVSDNGKTLKTGYKISKSGVYVIGHLHRRQSYSKRVYYPGTMYQRTFGEPLPKGFCRGTIKRVRGELEWDMDWIQTQPPYELHNIRINDPADFKLITKPDPHKIRQYKLFIRKGIEIPTGFLEDYPNVIETAGKLSVKEIESLEGQGFEIEVIDQSFNLLDKLDPFLASKGLNPEEIKIARRYLDKYQGM
jgi:DNA repair exonuclease SbcCD nuclease subunit